MFMETQLTVMEKIPNQVHLLETFLILLLDPVCLLLRVVLHGHCEDTLTSMTHCQDGPPLITVLTSQMTNLLLGFTPPFFSTTYNMNKMVSNQTV